MVEVPIFLDRDGEDVEACLRSFVGAKQMPRWPDMMCPQYLPYFLKRMALALHKPFPDAIKDD